MNFLIQLNKNVDRRSIHRQIIFPVTKSASSNTVKKSQSLQQTAESHPYDDRCVISFDIPSIFQDKKYAYL